MRRRKWAQTIINRLSALFDGEYIRKVVDPIIRVLLNSVYRDGEDYEDEFGTSGDSNYYGKLQEFRNLGLKLIQKSQMGEEVESWWEEFSYIRQNTRKWMQAQGRLEKIVNTTGAYLKDQVTRRLTK